MIMIIALASAIQPLRAALSQTLHTACKFLYDKSRANLMSCLEVGWQGRIAEGALLELLGMQRGAKRSRRRKRDG